MAHAFRESALRFVLLPWKEFTSRFDVYLVTGGNRVYAGGTDYSFFFPPLLFLFEFPRNQRVSADCPSLRKVCTIDREHEIRLKAERSRNTRHDFTFMAEHRDSNNNDDPRNLIRVRRCTKGFQRVNEWFTRNRGFSIFCFRLFFFFFFFSRHSLLLLSFVSVVHSNILRTTIQSGENEIDLTRFYKCYEKSGDIKWNTRSIVIY